MMTALLLSILAAGAVFYGIVYERRLRNDRLSLTTELRKWENEGGNVPQVPTVSPVVTPEKKVPAKP